MRSLTVATAIERIRELLSSATPDQPSHGQHGLHRHALDQAARDQPTSVQPVPDRPAPAQRVIIGLTGPPGAGKSTLAQHLLDASNRVGIATVVVPMDGFHLAQARLDERGLASVKGAPETFDADGYVALLHRLRQPAMPLSEDQLDGDFPETLDPQRFSRQDKQSIAARSIWAPAFDRSLEEPIAGAIEIPPGAELIITEGNYLLHRDEPWRQTRGLLDEVWFVDLPSDVRRARLTARHERFGRTPEDARAHALGSDERNALLINETRDLADALLIEDHV